MNVPAVSVVPARPTAPVRPRILILACGALARELREIVRLNQMHDVAIECLPARLHNRPEQIPDAVRVRIRAARPAYDRILVGYADCGTGGKLDRVCEQEGVERLPGAHCYELLAGQQVFAELHEAEPGTFYLTDYMVRHFDRLIMVGLGLADHPELRDMYFGNYTRAIHLAQTGEPALAAKGQQAAARLGLRHEYLLTGYADLARRVVELRGRAQSAPAEAAP